ncbi:hydrogenase formation protein HypD [uncultured Mailhella sp.]|uniref:hydrogenase formation protein HypD n=1 Tax=uncultured Mailhella sp. TaxID=1981031 RepID=UPI002605AB00|nr:hydrogenase formation protein HypD [uncultured Mailhella sp.]
MDLSLPFRDPALCRSLLDALSRELDAFGRPVRFMEVCGTHTVSIFQSGLRPLLPANLTHLSGPGCPVCVTHDSEIAAILEAAGRPGVIVAAFGDLLRVPGPDGRTLRSVLAEGARVQVVYSPLDAVKLAASCPGETVVFPAVGFETTAPAIAGALLTARRQGVRNFCILPCCKLVPPALRALLEAPDESVPDRQERIDAFLLPGHVAVVLGLAPFRFVAEEFGRPAVVGGFQPADILSALCLMVRMLREGRPAVGNTYVRAVSEEGSPAARQVMDAVFRPADAFWRGLGRIPQSGLVLRGEWADFDGFRCLGVERKETKPVPGCRCGDILRGRLTPDRCPLFGTVCTPQNPTGPCMVSTEGSCAAWYRYGGR